MRTDRVLEKRWAALLNARAPTLLAGARRGLEKESLRVTPEGRLARSPHPPALGSALKHPYITTDYSESLLELVTPPCATPAALLAFMDRLQQFVHARLDGELLWSSSMPCDIGCDADLPIAHYGSSHQGRFKEIYRRGLLTRYGGMMQAIAGVHFNYSFAADFWPLWADINRDKCATPTAAYFALLRNFRRHGWLVLYLFGASPALCSTFVCRDDAGLLPLGRGTLHGPHATSLRMSDIGYRNSGQSAVRVSVNSLEAYLGDLVAAVNTPHPPFAALGVKKNGEYQQLSANVLQIENEYYSYIRPKRVPRAGENMCQALARGGVEYLELRSLDLNAFDRRGIDEQEAHFLEALLLLLLCKESAPIDDSEQQQLDRNHLLVAREGRKPGLMLNHDGRALRLALWAGILLDEMQAACELLDAAHGTHSYVQALQVQRDKLRQPESLPSARVLAALKEQSGDFSAWTLENSRSHAEYYYGKSSPAAAPLDPEMERLAEESLVEQEAAEAKQSGEFDQYLRSRFANYVTDHRGSGIPVSN